MSLSKDQRKGISEFCCNLAVAWLAGGIIGPLVTGNLSQRFLTTAVTSMLWAAVLLRSMISLLGKSK